MIREELFHPLLSHFPIALLILVLFTKTAQIFVTKKSEELLKNITFTHLCMLFIGTLMLLPVIFLGDMAFDVIKSQVCNITDIYKHEEQAHNALYVFIFVLILEFIYIAKRVPKKFERSYLLFNLLAIILGVYQISMTAHSGAMLVYEQGAAVKVATRSCLNN